MSEGRSTCKGRGLGLVFRSAVLVLGLRLAYTHLSSDTFVIPHYTM
jgi:hypothetical protein